MDLIDSVKLTKQRDSLTAKQTTPVACVSDLLKCVEELEKSATTSPGHHTVDHLGKEGRRQWSTISIQSTVDGTRVSIAKQNYCQCNIRDHLRHWVAYLWTFPNTYTVS